MRFISFAYEIIFLYLSLLHIYNKYLGMVMKPLFIISFPMILYKKYILNHLFWIFNSKFFLNIPPKSSIYVIFIKLEHTVYKQPNIKIVIIDL